jgi:alpha-amylase
MKSRSSLTQSDRSSDTIGEGSGGGAIRGPRCRLAGSALLILRLDLLGACASGPPAGSLPASPPAAAATRQAAAAAPALGPSIVAQSSWDEAILYFVVLDRFADGDSRNNAQVDPGAKGAFHGGDLAGLTAQLDEIAGLGATAIWITPVVKNIPGYVTGAGFQDWGYHGYWADDFTRLDPRFGSEAQLEGLVEAAHARGIKVVLDVVYNHAGYESRYLSDARTRGWMRSEARGSCGMDDLTLCVAGLPDFRTELPEVAGYLMDAHLGLAKRVGLDGFRLDTVKHVDHPFWREHRRRSREELGREFFLVGEVWGGDAQSLDPWFAGDEIDAGFDFGFQGSVLGWLQGRGRTVAFDRYLASRHKVRAGYKLAHFLSSHDVPGALHQLGGNREFFRLAAALQFASLGVPVIYYGEEVGRAGGDWPENRGNMPWGDRAIPPGQGLARDETLRQAYRSWIAVRRAHPALWRGQYESLSSNGDLLVFRRRDAESGDEVVVAVNRGAQPATASFAWSGAGAPADLESGAAVGVAQGIAAVEIPARTARFLGLDRD